MDFRKKRNILVRIIILAMMFASAGTATAEKEVLPDAGSYHLQNSVLDIEVGENHSTTWNYLYDGVNWGDGVFLEHFGIWTNEVPILKSSRKSGGTSDFTVSSFFDINPNAVYPGNEAILTLAEPNIELKRQVLPTLNDRSFQIKYTIKNTGNTPINGLNFFEVIDYDIVTVSGDVGWYAPESDYVWMKDDAYFQNGFKGSQPSVHHGIGLYPGELHSDWLDGSLNDVNNFGPADTVVGEQWNLGNFAPSQEKTLTVTFWFGVPSGSERPPEETIPEFPTVAVPIISVLGIMFLMSRKKHN